MEGYQGISNKWKKYNTRGRVATMLGEIRLNQGQKEVMTFSGKGEIYSWTIVYDPPEGFEKYAPYAVALIKLDEGPLVTAMLTDVDSKDIFIGMRVESVTRELRQNGDAGLIVYGYKFRPVLERAE